MNGKKLLLDNSYIDYIKKIINVLLRNVMKEDGTINISHTSLKDMPSSSVADHDWRYFTRAEHKTTSAGATDSSKPIILNSSGLVDNTMLPHKVKVSENDSTTAFLEDKLDAGSGISLTTINEGANEQISVVNTDTGSGAVTTHESSYDHSKLHDAVTAGTGISVVGQEVSNNDTGSSAVSGHESTYDHTKLHDPATVADTNSIDMTLTGQEIKGDVRTQNSTSIDLSADSSGLKADLNSTLKSNYDTAYSNTHASGSDNQNLWATISADSGSTTANSQTDTLSIVGVGTVTTSITGDTLTITGSGGADTDEKVKVNSDDATEGYLEDKLTAGTGISLTTAVDDSDITIANTDTGSGAVGTHELSYDHSLLHSPVTVTDGTSIDFTLTGQDITAEIDSTLKSAYDGAVSASHTRKHDIDGTDDHNGLASFTENNFLSANASGLPKDSGSKASDFATAGHTHTFLNLTDTPSAYTSSAGKLVAVNSGADALEFITAPSGDDEKAKVSANDTTAGYLNGKLLAGEGIDLTEGSDGGDETLTISGEDATTTNKGIASFDTNNFSVSSGAVSIKDEGVDLTAEVAGTLPVGNGGTGLASLTANKMFYASDTDEIAQNDVYYDDIGKRLGINTDSHTRTLDVNGGVYVNAKFTGLGTVSVSASSTTVGGTSTKFQSQLQVGDYLTIDGITRTVATIASDTSLTVSSSFSSSALTDKTYTVLPLKAMEVVGDRINLKTTKTLDGSTQDVLVYRMEDATGQMGFFGYGQASNNTLFLLYNAKGSVRLSPKSGSNVVVDRVYGTTGLTGVVVGITSTGTLYDRGTSSIKYKKNISDIKNKEKSNNYKNLLNINSKTFNFNSEVLTYLTKEEEQEEHIGFIAEDLHNMGLTHLVSYDEKGEVHGVHYDYIPIYHHEIIKDHEQEIIDLKSKNEELEQRIKKLEEMILNK